MMVIIMKDTWMEDLAEDDFGDDSEYMEIMEEERVNFLMEPIIIVGLWSITS
ncbi:hypothetical protein KI387_018736, partial [Taxus chinensis]